MKVLSDREEIRKAVIDLLNYYDDADPTRIGAYLLARKLRVSVQAIGTWVTGINRPQWSNLVALSRLYEALID